LLNPIVNVATSVWQVSPGLDPIIQLWPDGGVVFSRATGDTHWVPESACLVLQALKDSPLSPQALQQKLAIQLEMAEDEADLDKIVNVACQMLLKANLIESVSC
jgi:PqqD family protein of HPr-rel-A system